MTTPASLTNKRAAPKGGGGTYAIPARLGWVLRRQLGRISVPVRASWLLIPVFALVTGRFFAAMLAGPGSFGYDARVYSVAARAMLEGADPWRTPLTGGYFAGPPLSLLPFVPFAYLPQELVAAIWVAANFVIAALALRAIGRPPWWLMFPPLFFAICMGSVEVALFGLLVIGGHVSGLSLILKPYAILPLIAERRWLAIMLGGVVFLVTFPFLPWGTFIADLPWIQSRLWFQTSGGFGPGSPLLFAVGAVALLSLGLRRALWLATPVLWPFSLPHYTVMTLPVMPTLLALMWALPIPNAMLVGVVVLAVAVRLPVWRRMTA